MIELSRVSNWEDRLSSYIQDKRDEPFAYGANDCAHFVAGAVEAVTGQDVFSDLRGTYDSEFGSLRVIKELGKSNLGEVIDTMFAEVSIGHAQRGDIAFFDGCIGVVMGSFAWFVSDNGLERIEREYWDKCWGVARG